jgi:hypothetical protein
MKTTNHETVAERPYWNPYLAGFLLGLVLLAAFVIMGRGLGASGAFTTLLASGVNQIAPEHAAQNEFYSKYLGDGSFNPLKDWLLFEVIGVLVGGFLSGALAGRLKFAVEKGPRISVPLRLTFALIGGRSWGSVRSLHWAAQAGRPFLEDRCSI